MELVLPRNYVEIEQEEMMYLYGGYRASKQVWVSARNVRMSLTKYKIISNTPAILFSSVAGLLLGGALGTIVGASISYTALFAKDKSYEYDMVDGKKDDMLTVFVPGHYTTINNPYPPNSQAGATW